MRYLYFLVLVLAGIASRTQTFKPIANYWNSASVNGIAPYGDSMHIVYGHGQFLEDPAPRNGCILKNGKAEPLPWELPYNTTSIITTEHGEMYIASTLGVYVLYGDTVSEIVRNTSATYALCYFDNSLYFGGTFGFIGDTEGNLARYNLLTGKLTVLTIPGAVKGIAPFPDADGTIVMYVLSSDIGHGLQKFSTQLEELPMTDEESNPAAYSGRSMIVWDNTLVITCLEPGDKGYIGFYDGYEWEYSHNLTSPEDLHISPSGDLYVSGALFENDSIYTVALVRSPSEITEFTDAEGRRILTTYYSQKVYLAWDSDRMYAVLNPGAWVEGYTENMHMFRIDDDPAERPTRVVTYPNPASDHITLMFPTRVLDMLYIYSLNGELVYTSIAGGLTTQIDTSYLQNGAYIISCGGYSTKVVIGR